MQHYKNGKHTQILANTYKHSGDTFDLHYLAAPLYSLSAPFKVDGLGPIVRGFDITFKKFSNGVGFFLPRF